MPWKIKNTTNIEHPDQPIIHMWDRTVNVNMVQHLESGVVDLWVGADEPDMASIHIVIDSEQEPKMRLEPTAVEPTHLDMQVMQTVLRSLGKDDRILRPLRPQPREFEKDAVNNRYAGIR